MDGGRERRDVEDVVDGDNGRGEEVHEELGAKDVLAVVEV